jgi:hypothetical protein
MPWYNENFDSDLEEELDERSLMLVVKNSLTSVLVRVRSLCGLLKEVIRSQDQICLKLQLIEQEMFMLMKKMLIS